MADQHSDDSSDTDIRAPVLTVRNALRYIREHGVEARVYSEYYYDERRRWTRVHYGVGFGAAALAAFATLSGVAIFSNPQTAQVVAAIVSAVSAMCTAANTMLKPSDRAKNAETAGDEFRVLSHSLLNVDASTELARLQSIVRKATKKQERLTLQYSEPSPARIQEVETSVVRRMRPSRAVRQLLQTLYPETPRGTVDPRHAGDPPPYARVDSLHIVISEEE